MLLDRLANKTALFRVGVTVGCVLVVAALTGLTWYGWLGWDHEYQIDEVTGLASGPYEAWQVVGCGLTLLGLAVVTSLLIHPRMLFVIPPAFTVVWSLDAAREDESGLWGVGAFMILIGMLSAAAVLAGLVKLVRRVASSGAGAA